MLRILVISLVVANLLLLGFQGSKPAAPPPATATPSEAKDTGIPTIHLFSEMMQDQDLLSGNRQCFSLGPFHSIEERDEVQTQLLEVSTHISERQTEALVEKGYWVYMPPYASLLEANEKLISLQALGLKDVAIIYEGEWKNAISLGYFLRQENAVNRKKALENKGYAPLMRVQRQAEPRYWLDYEQNPGSGLIALDMQDRPNDFMQRAVPCPEKDMFDSTVADLQEPAEEMAELQIPEEENDPGTDQGEEVGATEGNEIVPQEKQDLTQLQIPEEEKNPDPDQGEDVVATEAIEVIPPETQDLTVPQIPEDQSDLAPEEGETLDGVEGKDDLPIESAEVLSDQANETEPLNELETNPQSNSYPGTGEG